MATIFEKIKPIVVEQLGVDEKDVVPTASFVEDLGADSLDKVEIGMSVENHFNVTIPDEHYESVSSVGELQALLEKLLRDQQAMPGA